MFRRFFARARANEAIAYSLYGAIVAQARQPALYTEFSVPDTIDGRFEMVVLHAFLLFHRLKPEAEDDRQVGQGVFDVFLKDMDRSLREMGVGDIAVPKKLKKMTESFYGRVRAYDDALTGGDRQELVDAIDRNVFAEFAGPHDSSGLGDYVLRASSALQQQDVGAMLRGEIQFPSLDQKAAA